MPAIEAGPSVKTAPRATSSSRCAEHREPGGAGEARIEADIDRFDDGRNVGRALAEPVQDRGFAAVPVRDQMLDVTRRIADRVAVAGQIDRLAAFGELVQRGHVIAHGAVGRRHDGGRPAHDVIAGENQIGFLERERHVVGGVSRRGQRFKRPAVAAHGLAIGERDVGAEIHVGGSVEAARLADMQRPGEPVRAFGENFCAGRRLDLGHRRRMVAMGVGDEDVRHGLAAHRIEQRRDMGVVVRAGIEDRHLAAADDVADRALEGERARIVGGHRAHQRRHLFHRVGLEIERLVERDVVGHARTLLKRAAMMCTARASAQATVPSP